MSWLWDFFAFRQSKQVLDLQSKLDEKDRLIGVLKAEIDGLAAVIARDRARVAAETARFAREQADAEGTLTNDRSTQPSIR